MLQVFRTNSKISLKPSFNLFTRVLLFTGGDVNVGERTSDLACREKKQIIIYPQKTPRLSCYENENDLYVQSDHIYK